MGEWLMPERCVCASYMLASNVFNDIEIALSLFPYKMAIMSEVLHQIRNTLNRLKHMFDRVVEFNMKNRMKEMVVDVCIISLFQNKHSM